MSSFLTTYHFSDKNPLLKAFHFSLNNPCKLVYIDINQITDMDPQIKLILEMCAENSFCAQIKEISKEINKSNENEKYNKHNQTKNSYYVSEATLWNAVGFVSHQSLIPYFELSQFIRTKVYTKFLFDLSILPEISSEIASFMYFEESVESLLCPCGWSYKFIGRSLFTKQFEFECCNSKKTMECINLYLWDHCKLCGELFIVNEDTQTLFCFDCEDRRQAEYRLFEKIKDANEYNDDKITDKVFQIISEFL